MCELKGTYKSIGKEHLESLLESLKIKKMEDLDSSYALYRKREWAGKFPLKSLWKTSIVGFSSHYRTWGTGRHAKQLMGRHKCQSIRNVFIAGCRHSILHPWFNQGELLEWPSMFPKIMIALHALICSLHIIKWSWGSNGHDGMPGFQIGSSDWKISRDQVCMVSIHCV